MERKLARGGYNGHVRTDPPITGFLKLKFCYRCDYGIRRLASLLDNITIIRANSYVCRPLKKT